MSLAGHLVGGFINEGLAGVLSNWRQVYSFLAGGLGWLVEIIISPLTASIPGVWSIAVPFIVASFGLALLTIQLADCREEIVQLLTHRREISQGLEAGEFEDPQKIMLFFSAPRRNNNLAKLNFGSGSNRALLWKRLVEWERLWEGELKTAFSFLAVITLPLSLAAAYWALPYWLILLVGIALNQQGRNVIVEIKRSLIYNLAASWREVG